MNDDHERKKGKGGRPCRWWTAIPLAVAAVLFALTTSCAAVGGLFEPGEPVYVLADAADVPANLMPPPVPTVLPVKMPDGTDTGRVYVLVEEEALPPQAPRIPIASAPEPEAGWIPGLTGLLSGPLGPFAPVAGLLLAKLVASRRGRLHGANAVKALARLDIGGATMALAKADGWAHTKAPPPPVDSGPPASTAQSAG